MIFLGRSRILFTHISETGEVPKWLPARSNDREGDPSQTTGQGFAKPLDRLIDIWAPGRMTGRIQVTI
ncbi:MAG: hypothetical protein UT94_C0048G0008 [Candidatus Uhrbacteria bacterium GW2011_GWF2_40_263]|nr:MAG: hypothetical protein UT94_C0048G0008 [Candidatus Uhrbacteria bacterium GW2011_GWF2_40_263]